MSKQTVMKVVCAWCGADMGTKNGKGQTGTTHSICPECVDKEWAKLGGRPPARWNLVGRFLARRRGKKRAAQIAQDAEEAAEDNEALLYLLRNNPNLHAQCMLRGDRGRHYILVEDLATLQAAAATEPEIKCYLN